MASARIEIVRELRALEQFCTFKTVRNGEEQERFLKDYLADIQEFPFEAIQRACAEWRKSGSTKFPTSGQLIPIIRLYVTGPRTEAPKAWAHLSGAEYDALDLPGKIRHHKILSAEARRKAGPMCKAGKGPGISRASIQHLTPEELSPTWRKYTEIADGHDREARRLMDYYYRKPSVAAE